MNIDRILKKKAKEAFFEFRKKTPSLPLPKEKHSQVRLFTDEELHQAIFLAQETVREFPDKNNRSFLTRLYKERKRREV